MTTSLELSKQLAEKGLKIETEKWWAIHLERKLASIIRDDELLHYGGVINNPFGWEMYPAPSTDELLAVMPKCLINYIKKFPFNVTISLGSIVHQEEDDCLSNALGRICLWLLLNGYEWDGKEKMIRRFDL